MTLISASCEMFYTTRQVPVGFKKVVIPVDHVTGQQNGPDPGLHGRLHRSVPGSGRSEASCLCSQVSGKTRRRAPQVNVANREDLHLRLDAKGVKRKTLTLT